LNCGIPRLIRASLFKLEPQANKKAVEARSLNSAFYPVFWGTLYVVKVSKNLIEELENSNNASCNIKRVYVKERCGDIVGRYKGVVAINKGIIEDLVDKPLY